MLRYGEGAVLASTTTVLRVNSEFLHNVRKTIQVLSSLRFAHTKKSLLTTYCTYSSTRVLEYRTGQTIYCICSSNRVRILEYSITLCCRQPTRTSSFFCFFTPLVCLHALAVCTSLTSFAFFVLLFEQHILI